MKFRNIIPAGISVAAGATMLLGYITGITKDPYSQYNDSYHSALVEHGDFIKKKGIIDKNEKMEFHRIFLQTNGLVQIEGDNQDYIHKEDGRRLEYSELIELIRNFKP